MNTDGRESKRTEKPTQKLALLNIQAISKSVHREYIKTFKSY